MMVASKLGRRIVFYSVGLALVLSIGLTAYNQAQKGLWKAEIRRLNEKLAYWEARKDFVNGRARLLRIGKENWELKFTGEHEGPFEIWLAVHFPSTGEINTYSEQQYVYYFNLYMRNFQLRAEQLAKEKEKNKKDETPAKDESRRNR